MNITFTIIFAAFVVAFFCIPAAMLFNCICDWCTPAAEPNELKPSLGALQFIPPPIPSAPVISFAPPGEPKPPSLPAGPKPSVSAAKFLAQIKAERAQQQEAPKLIPAERPEVPQASKKRSKLSVSLILCGVFAAGAVAGSIGGCAAVDRYELAHVQNGIFRIDKLTGKVWILGKDGRSGWGLFEEQSSR